MKIKILVLLLIFCSPIIVEAEECSDREIVNLKKLASNVNYAYEYYEVQNKMYFDITINNVYKDIYVLNLANNKKYTSEEIKLQKISDGQVITLEVYAKNCQNELLTKKTITLPTFNKYFDNPLCEDIHEYKYCSRWGKYSIDESELEKYTKEYKNKIETITDEKTIKYQTDIKGFYVFVALILLILILILLSIFKRKKNKNII